ncbi:MAG: bifunctional class I SAM-dependent methyltransferase/glycosyltransferase family 2 protein [Verrucomicrobiae bacterium]|nr:bifunctional class I SAM-dependent methyltransferase/glycosyltransferase family 2 protein [Verrucomicrobiae bacterium]
MNRNTTREHYDRIAANRANWRGNRFFQRETEYLYTGLIPEGASILQVGCGLGDLLAALKPVRGVGVDFSSKTIEFARQRHPRLEFICSDIHEFQSGEKFDYIVVSSVLGDLDDIQACFERLRARCHSRTRLIVDYYSMLWQPLWNMAEKLNWKTPQPLQNWLRTEDVINLLQIAGFEPVVHKRRHLCPLNIPLLAPFCNRILAHMPLFQNLCFGNCIVARPIMRPETANLTCSVIVPCRNEKGNIARIFKQTPPMGAHTELIFIDGNSTDGTLEEIERQARANPQWNAAFFSQGAGTGKGDAVRQGFARAKGDVLMILDADLTMPAQNLPKFFQCLADERAEFVNGSRLVYPMEKQAMRFLNLLANWSFGRMFTWLLGQTIRDTLCGTKVLLRKDYERIAAGRAYFGDFDPFGDFDLLFGAAKLNLKIVDLPIRYKERTYGTTNIRRFYHGWQLLKMCGVALVKLKLR